MNSAAAGRVHQGEEASKGSSQEKDAMKTLMTTSLMAVLLTGTTLLAQAGKAPAAAPATAATNPTNPANPTPAKVKKHHKGKKNAAPAENASPAKK